MACAVAVAVAVVVLVACGAPEEPGSAAPSVAPTATVAPTAGAPTSTAEPQAASLPDGVVAEVAGGLLYIVWDGTKERIAQPAPFDDATIDELGLRIRPPVARFRARPQPDPRTFWVVYPATGPRARLHLAVADRLYPVRTVAARPSQIDRLPVAPESLLNRMRPARS